MTNVTWKAITCEEREAIVGSGEQRYAGLGVHSSLTDHYGTYGTPIVETVWCNKVTEQPVLRDVRHPALNLEHNPLAPDREPCEHYVPQQEKEARP